MTVVGLLQYALSHDVCRAGEESVDVTYTYDINSILEVEVKVLSTGEVRKQIIDAQNVADPQNRYMSSVALLGSNNPNFHMLCRVTNFNPNNPQDCMDLRIQFENCGDGDSVTFDANLCDVNNNPGSRPLTLTLRLVEENGLLRPKFEFASTAIAGIWDGRTNVRN